MQRSWNCFHFFFKQGSENDPDGKQVNVMFLVFFFILKRHKDDVSKKEKIPMSFAPPVQWNRNYIKRFVGGSYSLFVCFTQLNIILEYFGFLIIVCTCSLIPQSTLPSIPDHKDLKAFRSKNCRKSQGVSPWVLMKKYHLM